MLPASPTFSPASRNIWYISDVVVVFPLLPVIHIILAFVYRPANSISEIMGMPAFCAFCTMGASLGMPGLFIISCAPSIFSSVCCFSSHSMLCSSSICLYLSAMLPKSDTNTPNPSFCARTAAPHPLSPAPSIAICFSILSYFKRH